MQQAAHNVATGKYAERKKGGPPASLLGSLGKALSLGLSASQKAALDAGLFGAEIVGCLVPQRWRLRL